MIKWVLLAVLISFSIINSSFIIDKNNYENINVKKEKPCFISSLKAEQWADSVLQTLSLDEKIGQLIMIDAHPTKDRKHWEQLLNYVENYKVGGVIFFKSGPKQLALMSNYLQERSKIPLLTSIDAEWGLAMRMDSVLSFPVQMALGAINNNELIYDMGKAIARQLKRLGIHINFAPVLDINNNPSNPVINVRSFGDNKKLVLEKAIYYMRGMQDEHVLAVGKHFPGHGDTQTDSHHDLPYLALSRKRLDSLELYPFREIIKEGIGGIMVAHLDVPALNANNKCPTTLSYEVVTNLLRKEMNFQGIIFTDALNMKGATKYFKPGMVALKALLAGNDVLLYPEEIPLAIQYIKEAVYDSILCPDELDAHVKRILMLKYWAGLNQCQYVDTTNIYKDLNDINDEFLIRKITEESLTLLKNENKIIPIQKLDTLKIAFLNLEPKRSQVFYNYLSLYASIDSINLPDKPNSIQINKIIDSLKNYNLIITSLHQTNRYSFRTFNFSHESLNLLKEIDKLHKKIILVSFASPYSLKIIPDITSINALIMAYESNAYTQELSAQLIFGGITAKGKLPVNVNNKYFYNLGLETEKSIRLKYTLPEELGISSKSLAKADSIINKAIALEAFPGCQVLVAKDGKVFYHKAFGKLFYDSLPNSIRTLYDLASITKVVATTLATMALYEQNKIDLHAEIGDYLPMAKNTDKEHISIDDILTHQARLTAWIPFYKTMINDSIKKSLYFSNSYSKDFPNQVADNIFASVSIKDSIYKRIFSSKLLPSKKYVYSDLGFYILKEIIEKQTNKSIAEYCEQKFYKPLGCTTTMYNPLRKFNKKQIAPTEFDNEFRKQLIWGYVHDPGASLTNGIQGHAGVFSTANDLAKIGQMLLWNGKYGGESYFKPSTIKLFTSCYHCPQNRRGLGFDKPEPNPDKDSPVTSKASLLTFGHQGFTGTCIWIDPKEQLIYIFLSNRIHPSAANTKINKLGIRNKVLDVFYDALPKN
ncbi:MAG: glycoside hydrolase family 3 N-terminal domain-containing protein [Bacteroidales bacterium]